MKTKTKINLLTIALSLAGAGLIYSLINKSQNVANIQDISITNEKSEENDASNIEIVDKNKDVR